MLSSEEEDMSSNQENKLPTNEELVKLGVRAFEQIYQDLPDNLKEFFLNNHYFRTLLIGTTPQTGVVFGRGPGPGPVDEEGYFVIPTDQVALLKATITRLAPFINFYYSSKNPVSARDSKPGDPPWGVIERAEALNIPAAVRVVRNYPDYFPKEAQIDPGKWLLDHMSEWDTQSSYDDQHETRFGLLSGFPLTAVLNYIKLKPIRAALSVESELITPDERAFWSTFLDNKNRTDVDQARINQILKKADPDISDVDINLLGQEKRIGGVATDRFHGFSKEDEEYIKELDQVYQNSGIDELAEKLKG